MMTSFASDGALKITLSFSESPKLNSLDVQLGQSLADISSLKKLEIDCLIDYVEIESELIIGYCNRVVTELAPQLEQLVFGLSIKGYETEISEESDCTEREIVVAARDRWMKDLACLRDSFQHLSKLEHLSFILSVDEDTYDSFYRVVDDCAFLYIYEPEFIFQLLELENIKTTLQSLSLNFDHADGVSESVMSKFFVWLNDENTLMKNLSICSSGEFYLRRPSNACYVENLTLKYEDCFLDKERLVSTVETLEKFPRLSRLNLEITDERERISKKDYTDALHFIASSLRRRKGLHELNLLGDFSPEDTRVLGKHSIFNEASEGKSDDEDTSLVRKLSY
jgi:hypothetical protein